MKENIGVGFSFKVKLVIGICLLLFLRVFQVNVERLRSPAILRERDPTASPNGRARVGWRGKSRTPAGSSIAGLTVGEMRRFRNQGFEPGLLDPTNQINSKEIKRFPFRAYLEQHGLTQYLDKTYIRYHRKEAKELLRIAREEYVSKFDNLPVVSIRGLMSSGTNWMRSLMNQHCPGSVMNPETEWEKHMEGGPWEDIYGWKHAYIEPFEIERLTRNKEHKMVLITRDAMTWSIAMTVMSHMPTEVGVELYRNREASMYQFLDTKFSKLCASGQSWYYERCILEKRDYILKAKNILAWRTAMYRQFYDLAQQYPDTFFIVRYEDLRTDLNGTWATQFLPNAPSGFNCKSSLPESKYRVKFGKVTDTKIDKYFYERAACLVYSRENSGRQAFDMMVSNLDLDLERKLGYSYESPTQTCKYKKSDTS